MEATTTTAMEQHIRFRLVINRSKIAVFSQTVNYGAPVQRRSGNWSFVMAFYSRDAKNAASLRDICIRGKKCVGRSQIITTPREFTCQPLVWYTAMPASASHLFYD